MLRGTIRDRQSGQRRAFVRFFACEEDLSNESPDAPLPDRVVTGEEPLPHRGRHGRRLVRRALALGQAGRGHCFHASPRLPLAVAAGRGRRRRARRGRRSTLGSLLQLGRLDDLTIRPKTVDGVPLLEVTSVRRGRRRCGRRARLRWICPADDGFRRHAGQARIRRRTARPEGHGASRRRLSTTDGVGSDLDGASDIEMAQYLTTNDLPLAVGGYAAGFFVVVGVSCTRRRIWIGHGSSGHPMGAVTWRTAVATLVLTGYAVGAIAIPTHPGFTHAVPVGDRWWLLIVLFGMRPTLVLGTGHSRLARRRWWRP